MQTHRVQANGTPLLFQNEHAWLVFASAMDIMMTWVLLHRGGREANPSPSSWRSCSIG